MAYGRARDVLHVHRNPTLSNHDRLLAQCLVSLLHDIADLKLEVLTRATVAPVERFQGEHTLRAHHHDLVPMTSQARWRREKEWIFERGGKTYA